MTEPIDNAWHHPACNCPPGHKGRCPSVWRPVPMPPPPPMNRKARRRLAAIGRRLDGDEVSMESEIGRDLPVLVALVRTQDRLRQRRPTVQLDADLVAKRLHSDASRNMARVLLGTEAGNSTVQAKAKAIRKLALGR